MLELGVTYKQLAEKLGVPKSNIAYSVNLLRLVPESRKVFLAGRLSVASAQALSRVTQERAQLLALADFEAQRAKHGEVTVRVAAKLVEKYVHRPEPKALSSRRRKERREAASQNEAALTAALLEAVAEAGSRKAFLDDADVRVLLLALTSTSDAALDALTAAGASAEKLGQTKGPKLRGLLLRVALGPWLADPEARAAVAKAYRVDLETLARQVEAEAVFAK